MQLKGQCSIPLLCEWTPSVRATIFPLLGCRWAAVPQHVPRNVTEPGEAQRRGTDRITHATLSHAVLTFTSLLSPQLVGQSVPAQEMCHASIFVLFCFKIPPKAKQAVRVTWWVECAGTYERRTVIKCHIYAPVQYKYQHKSARREKVLNVLAKCTSSIICKSCRKKGPWLFHIKLHLLRLQHVTRCPLAWVASTILKRF